MLIWPVQMASDERYTNDRVYFGRIVCVCARLDNNARPKVVLAKIIIDDGRYIGRLAKSEDFRLMLVFAGLFKFLVATQQTGTREMRDGPCF